MSKSIPKYYEIEHTGYTDYKKGRIVGWSWCFSNPIASNWISSRSYLDLFETKHEAEVSALEHWEEVGAFIQRVIGDDG